MIENLGQLNSGSKIRFEALYDNGAGVFVFTSPDLPGLIVEISSNKTLEEARNEINDCLKLLTHADS